ncbi:MAG: bifunctional oligoribonuclease/PAP phosphatase NrnA [Endomicrobiia bacterium]
MIQINKKISKQIFEIIEQSKTIFITGHTRPDGDTIGSSLALRYVLKKIGKQSVDIIMKERFMDCYSFLPDVDKILFSDKIDKTYDLAIILECSDISRIGFELNFNRFKKIINIDHHLNNHTVTKKNCLNIFFPQYASCAEIIFDILENEKIEIDKNIALCLYVGIVTDTGKFQWSNTNSHVFNTSAKLLKYGLNTFYIYKKIYGSKSLESIHLLSLILQTLEVKKIGKYNVSCIIATKKMFEDTSTTTNDTEEFINFALSVKDVDIAIFFREEKSGNVKISFRSDSVDVRKIAQIFNGGGHKYASGATVRGDMVSVREKVLRYIGRIK